MSINLAAGQHDNFDKLDALRKELQLKETGRVTEWRPSASQPDESPMARRTAKGKSLTGTQSRQIRVSGAQSAMKTHPNNFNRDKSGHRQLSTYGAKKVATRTLTTEELHLTEPIKKASKDEVRDRLTNPNNRNYQGNPVILNNRPVR